MTDTRTPLPSLAALDPAGEFPTRHIGPDAEDVAAMCAALGVTSVDELVDQVVPEAIRRRDALDIGPSSSEVAVIARLRAIAERNEVFTSLIGTGYTGTVTPPVIARNVLENPAWPGTRPTRRTNPRSARAAWRRC